MHFDQREQRALREAGLSAEEVADASAAVAEAVREEAAALEAFFDAGETFVSDMDVAHSSAEYPEHAVDHLDLYTHGGSLRGWLRFDTWGAYVEDGRVLTDEVVELTLGPRVHGRVRFAADPGSL